MRLDDFLNAYYRRRRGAFAAKAGCSSNAISLLARDRQWPGRELAIRIRQASGGLVTPNDFLPPFELAAGEVAALPFVDSANGGRRTAVPEPAGRPANRDVSRLGHQESKA